MAALELNDVQGIIVRGYGDMEAACFLMLEISSPRAAREWLGDLVGEVTNGKTKPSDARINLAVTLSGLETLGLDPETVGTFSREFQEGMTTEHRQRLLGDHGESSPLKWRWGASHTRPVHVLLMLYAPNDVALDKLYRAHLSRLSSGGLTKVEKLETRYLSGRKEHFGFRDGIGQPAIAGKDAGASQPSNTVADGEFLLGYQNEYGQYPSTPELTAARDPDSLLSPATHRSGMKDLGRNGSYLVFRQLSQDVIRFWRFLDGKTRRPDGSADLKARLKLASKMVGRWPSGAPLVEAPEHDQPDLSNENKFGYHDTDLDGLMCPVGSHIRRSNPRDTLVDSRVRAIELSKRHRIIRRGRAYGTPVDPSMNPGKMLEAAEPDGERGLHFLCFNANIGRQFEFIQHTWANNPKFQGLYDDADPIIGDHDPKGAGALGTFVAPAEPVRRRVTGLPRFVEVRGGGYFFQSTSLLGQLVAKAVDLRRKRVFRRQKHTSASHRYRWRSDRDSWHE